jgi:hypothetical protein
LRKLNYGVDENNIPLSIDSIATLSSELRNDYEGKKQKLRSGTCKEYFGGALASTDSGNSTTSGGVTVSTSGLILGLTLMNWVVVILIVLFVWWLLSGRGAYFIKKSPWAIVLAIILLFWFISSPSGASQANSFANYVDSLRPSNSLRNQNSILPVTQSSVVAGKGTWTVVVAPDPNGATIPLGPGKCHDLQFTASGQVNIGRGAVGPEGEYGYVDTSMVSPFKDKVGGLILRANDNYVFVGSSLRKTVCADSLTLLVNESYTGSKDPNTGSFNVMIKKL